MRKEILDRNPDLDIAVLAVWVPVLGTDDAASAQRNVAILDDPHVRQFYDPDARTGRWFRDNVIAGDAHLSGRPLYARGITWDTFLLYGPDTAWTDAPAPALASGATIVREFAILTAAVERLPRGARQAAQGK